MEKELIWRKGTLLFREYLQYTCKLVRGDHTIAETEAILSGTPILLKNPIITKSALEIKKFRTWRPKPHL